MLKRMILLGLAVVLVSSGAAFADFSTSFEGMNPYSYYLDPASSSDWQGMPTASSTASLRWTGWGDPVRTGTMSVGGRGDNTWRNDQHAIGGTYTTGVVTLEAYHNATLVYPKTTNQTTYSGLAGADPYNSQIKVGIIDDKDVATPTTIKISWEDSLYGTGYPTAINVAWTRGQWVGLRTIVDLDNNTIDVLYNVDGGAWSAYGAQKAMSAGSHTVSSVMLQQMGSESHADDISVTWVPEPVTLSVLALGGALVLLRRRR